MTIEHRDFPLCDHGCLAAGTWELTVAKGNTDRILYLCDECADRIRPQHLDCGITITLQPIGGWQ